MALHPRQQFKGRTRLLIRETIKDMQSCLAHDRRTPNNLIIVANQVTTFQAMINLLIADLAQTINR